MKNFSVYEYPPPDMKKGCEAMAGWVRRARGSFNEQKW